MIEAGRTYAEWATPPVREEFGRLLAAARDHDSEHYRTAMTAIGARLGEELRGMLPPDGDIVFVTTVEDADFLGRGVLDALGRPERIKLFCYWNRRNSDLDSAPVFSRYEEPVDEEKVTALIVLKSIVSGACVVRTNLTEALASLHHEIPVFVVAPVMHKDAKKKLRREFAADVADRFQYLVAAIDSAKDGENVKPGIGGSVYELLGLGDKNTKNGVLPQLVAERTG